MRISDWSSDVCSSDLEHPSDGGGARSSRGDRARVDDDGAHVAVGPRADLEDQQCSRDGYRHDHLLGEVEAPRCLQIGRASCRERVCQYVSISVVAGSLKKKTETKTQSILKYYN